jgi:hypothetical protein
MDFITAELVFVALAYVVGTLFGRYTARKDNVNDIIESTIDSLINDGYIKTKGEGKTLELLKHWES